MHLWFRPSPERRMNMGKTHKIDSSLYRFATQEHKEKFEQFQAENEMMRKLLKWCDEVFEILSFKKQTADLRTQIEQALKGE